MRLLSKLLLLFVLFAISLLPALFIGPVGGFFPAALLAALFLCSAVCALTGALRLQCSICLRGQVFVRGTATEAVFTLKNRSPLPLPRVTATAAVIQPGGETQRFTRTLTFAPGQTQRFTLPVAFAHVGRCRIRLEKLGAEDLSGLFTFSLRGHAALETVIAPRLETTGTAARRQRQDEDSAAIPSGLPTGNYDGVRQYAPGDPLHGIHWKLTAHTGAFISRAYEQSSRRGFTIIADLAPQAGTPAEYDRLAEEPLRAALTALESGLDVTVFYAGAAGPCRIHPAGRGDLETLGRHWAAAADHPTRGDLSAALSGAQAGGLLLCTARLTDTLVRDLLARQKAGAQPALLWVTGTAPSDTAARISPLVQAGVDCRVLPPVDRAQDTAPRAADMGGRHG